jgi:hypothetical protein
MLDEATAITAEEARKVYSPGSLSNWAVGVEDKEANEGVVVRSWSTICHAQLRVFKPEARVKTYVNTLHSPYFDIQEDREVEDLTCENWGNGGKDSAAMHFYKYMIEESPMSSCYNLDTFHLEVGKRDRVVPMNVDVSPDLAMLATTLLRNAHEYSDFNMRWAMLVNRGCPRWPAVILANSFGGKFTSLTLIGTGHSPFGQSKWNEEILKRVLKMDLKKLEKGRRKFKDNPAYTSVQGYFGGINPSHYMRDFLKKGIKLTEIVKSPITGEQFEVISNELPDEGSEELTQHVVNLGHKMEAMV